jgi:hypothetical protein
MYEYFKFVADILLLFTHIMQENNKVELSRLDRERREDFLEMLKGYVTSQVLFQISEHCISSFVQTFLVRKPCQDYYMALFCTLVIR